MNFVVTGAEAYSLKMTELSVEMEVTLLELLINLFAIVSTGWKTISSAIPADPAKVSTERYNKSQSRT